MNPTPLPPHLHQLLGDVVDLAGAQDGRAELELPEIVVLVVVGLDHEGLADGDQSLAAVFLLLDVVET